MNLDNGAVFDLVVLVPGLVLALVLAVVFARGRS